MASDPFVRPEGAAGARAGQAMAIENAPAERWAARAVPATGRVLEIGCGPGVGLSTLGRRAVGVDVSRPMVQEAKRRAPAAAVVQADAVGLPFPDASFHAAIAVHCLALMPARALAEVRRALVPDGSLIAVHRPPAAGGPEPARMAERLREAGFRRVDCRALGERSVFTGRR